MTSSPIEFKIRKNSKYLDVSILCGATQIDFGLLDESERLALARTLEGAVYELTEGLK